MTREVHWFLVFWVFASSLPQLSGSGPCPRDSFLEADAWAPWCLVWTRGGRTHLAALSPESQLAARTSSGPWASSGSASGASLVENHCGLRILHLPHPFFSCSAHSSISGPPAVFGLVCQHPLEILKMPVLRQMEIRDRRTGCRLILSPWCQHQPPSGHSHVSPWTRLPAVCRPRGLWAPRGHRHEEPSIIS